MATQAELQILLKGKDQASATLQRVGGNLQNFSKRIRMVSLALVGLSVAIIGLSVKLAVDFDKAMREVNTMLLLTSDNFKALSRDVLQLSKDIGVNATEMAKALYQAISAGIPLVDVLEFMAIATKAAIGGVTDLTTSVDGLTSIINAFKMPMASAQRVADVMFTTVKRGKTTFDELSAAIFNVAPMAAAIGIKFEEIAAALATMTKQGIPTKIATTSLRQALVALSKPTIDMIKVIEELGYESAQLMLYELGLAGTLFKVSDAAAGNTEKLMKMFGSVEAGQAVLALTGRNAETFTEDLDAMQDAAGAATDAFNQMEESAARAFERMTEKLKAFGIEIGTVFLPYIEKMVDGLTKLINKLDEMKLALPVAALLVLAGVIGGVGLALPYIITGVGLLATAFTFLAGAILAASGPIIIVAAAIATLIAIGWVIYKQWFQVVPMFRRMWNEIGIVIEKVGDAIKRTVMRAVEWVFKLVAALKAVWDWLLALMGLGGAGAGVPAKAKPLRDVPPWGKWEGFPVGRGMLEMEPVYPMQYGGIVSRPSLVRVAEKEPELITPLSQAGGININIYGNVVDWGDLMEQISIGVGEHLSETQRMGG